MTRFITAAATVALAVTAGAADARTVRVVGSSTVYPFAAAVAQQFAQRNPRFGTPVVESTGTGGGIKLFCAGVGAEHPDIATASRRIKSGEVAACRGNGVTGIVEVQVGLDGIVLAHAKRAPDFPVTTVELYRALAAMPYGKPNKAKTWRDINPKFPATKIEVLGPPPTSGTRDAFNELIMTAGCEKSAAMAAMKKTDEAKQKTICTKVREDGAFVEAGENDNLIVQKLNANPNALGIFGYSYLEENGDKMKGLPVNGVEPTYETISNFSYPGARPLFIYVKAQHLRAVPGLREYVGEFAKDSTWGPQGYLIRRGLVAAPPAVRQKAAATAASMTLLDSASVK